VLRVQPDGSQTLIEKINAVAKTELNAALSVRPASEELFEVLGSTIVRSCSQGGSRIISSVSSEISIPQWAISEWCVDRDRPASYAGGRELRPRSSQARVCNGVFLRQRLVTLPLIADRPLSLLVFWMDSVAGRSDQCIVYRDLTAVAYQVVMSEILHRSPTSRG
jgi:hypothetical protein